MRNYQKPKSLNGFNYRTKLVKRMKGRPERLKATASWKGRSDSVHPDSSSWRERSDRSHPATASWKDRPASIHPDNASWKHNSGSDHPATASWKHNSNSVPAAPSSWSEAREVSRPMAWGNEYWEEQSLYDPYQYRSG
jgi:hypothetical protein